MASKKPNFLVIVADDLGYSDVKPFGGEIDTPCLDELAKDGTRLTNFHTASACSPTRSMLFSGTDNHIAGLGQLSEHMAPNVDYKSHPGYEGYLNFQVAALSEVLQDSGYYCALSGKWHLGTTVETSPHARGFDDSFTFLSGCGNHFNYEPQLDKPSDSLFTPMNAGKFWMENDRFLDRRKDLPSDFYSSTTFADKLVGYLSSRKQSAENKDKPFFAYLPFTAPHWPLQAPKDVIEKYKGRYDDGPYALREKRLQKLKDLGLIPKDVDAAPMSGYREERAWKHMTSEEKAESARKMEVFAAMVESMDRSIATVIDHLKETNELDNTFVLFMSDNGAEGAFLEAMPIMGGQDSVTRIINQYYDNSLDNMGAADSFIWYGAEWACAAMAPSRGYKCWITEGGIRCPCLVRYPPGISQDLQNTNSFATVMDIFPTVLELAGVALPDKKFRGRDIVPLRGSSWLPHLSGRQAEFHADQKHITGWELVGCRAIREGKYKLLSLPPPRGSGEWELYDVEADPGEMTDLAALDEFKGVLERLKEHWRRYYLETGMFNPEQRFGYAELE
ncbi:hypothetical protein MBLNU230_g1273t1 [Neophaeotheca triangularis]